jgi:hypothetical protein
MNCESFENYIFGLKTANLQMYESRQIGVFRGALLKVSHAQTIISGVFFKFHLVVGVKCRL